MVLGHFLRELDDLGPQLHISVDLGALVRQEAERIRFKRFWAILKVKLARQSEKLLFQDP